MKIFRTDSGALYIVHDVQYFDGYGYPATVGYRVLRFTASINGWAPEWDDRVDSWHLSHDRLQFVKDHEIVWTSTRVNYDVDRLELPALAKL